MSTLAILLLVVLLYCADCYATSSIFTPLHTYISYQYLHISFLLGLGPKLKNNYVEQVEKSFLCYDEGVCRDVTQ